jgi:hypothetical protein
MIQRFTLVLASFGVLLGLPAAAQAQVVVPTTAYYLGLGDSVAAGTGAQPATNGYVYRLYEHGVFGRTQVTGFANAAVRGARSWDVRDHQVPQVLCTEQVERPTVVTVTAGANDLFRNDLDVQAIARRVAEAVNLLFNNQFLPSPVRDPVTGLPCRALEHVTVLVSNYYSIPHPVPAIAQQLDGLLQGFDQALRFWLGQIVVPPGSRLAVVDLYTPSLGRQGLVGIDRRGGFEGPFDFDPHPTNVGHTFIAREFQRAWSALQP